MNANRLFRNIAGGLLAAVIIFSAGQAQAETAMTTAPGKVSASARLMFKIVIPSVVIVDTKTGTVFSNDAKAIPMIGRELGDGGQAKIVQASGAIGQGLRPVAQMPGAASTIAKGKLVARGLAPGEVLVVP